MLKEEFLKLTGTESISDYDYNEIDEIYNEVNCSKEDFCKVWMGKDNSLSKLRSCLKDLTAKLVYTRSLRDAWSNRAKQLAEKIIKDNVSEADAYDVLGFADAIKFKIANCIELDEEDFTYITNHLN